MMLREPAVGPPSEGLPLTVQAGLVWYSHRRLRPTRVFATYWRYACQRQEIFYRRLLHQTPPWTDDPILRSHRFTNVYRASDRVTQYLVGRVIPGSLSPRDVLFRTILFKIFNRVATWEELRAVVGEPHVEEFDVDRYDQALTNVLAAGERLYSGAYIMPSPRLGHSHKHTNHLQLLRSMLDDELPERLMYARSMREAYEMLLQYPSLGRFLAFQYVIDLNYGDLLNFSEMEFVSAGPGAISGISKCFQDTGGLSAEDVIRATADMADQEFQNRGLRFLNLWTRPLQLIDCQNLYCEVDKYAREAHPDFRGTSGRHRIKQGYRRNPMPIEMSYPPKWNLHPHMNWPPLADLTSGLQALASTRGAASEDGSQVVEGSLERSAVGYQDPLPIFESADLHPHWYRGL